MDFTRTDNNQQNKNKEGFRGDKRPTSKDTEKKRILIVEDSQLKNVDEDKLSNETKTVKVKSVGGMITENLIKNVEHNE